MKTNITEDQVKQVIAMYGYSANAIKRMIKRLTVSAYYGAGAVRDITSYWMPDQFSKDVGAKSYSRDGLFVGEHSARIWWAPNATPFINNWSVNLRLRLLSAPPVAGAIQYAQKSIYFRNQADVPAINLQEWIPVNSVPLAAITAGIDWNIITDVDGQLEFDMELFFDGYYVIMD